MEISSKCGSHRLSLDQTCSFSFSSMVIRDLTLRSAASFGSFHLIRLLYDEYMFFLIEHKVAKAAGKTPIAIMTEVLLSVCVCECEHTYV